MSEDMADLQVWLDRKFNAIDERIRKIEATDEPDSAHMVVDHVSREAVGYFCDAFGIDNDVGLNSLLRDIEAFDGGLEESWEELQELRQKDENMRDNLGDVLERVNTASEMITDLRRNL